jgi:hypothetical protein
MNKTKLYRIAENLASDLYSYQDGETDVNRIYKTLESAVYNMREFQSSNHDRLWVLFCTLCHFDRVYEGALNHYKNDLMAMIIK